MWIGTLSRTHVQFTHTPQVQFEALGYCYQDSLVSGAACYFELHTFFIGKRSTWVGAALTPNTLASCDSGITLHDDSKRRSFISYKLREQPSKGTVFALVNVPSNALAGLSPQIRDRTRFTGGVAVAFCP